MNEKQIIRTQLYTMAANLVDATGTIGDAHDVPATGAISLAGDVSAAIGEQFYQAMEYVNETPKPTKEGLDEYLRSKKFSISWTLFSSGLKIAKQQADFKGGSKCVAETVELTADAFDFGLSVGGTAASSGLTFWLSAMKGVALLAQLYAAGKACADVISQGITDLGTMTVKEIEALAKISGRIGSAVNRFANDSIRELAKAIDPDLYDFSLFPKGAFDELSLGLLSTLRLFAIAGPEAGLKLAATTMVSQEDAQRIGNAIIMANNRNANRDTFTEGQKREATGLAAIYSKRSYGGAFAKLVDELRIGRKPTV